MSTADLCPSDAVNAIELDWYDENELVRVRAKNQQRFEIQKDKAIQALQLANEADQFQKQFNLLLERLASWLREYPAKISNAVVTLQDNALAFVVVRSDTRYDTAFEDALASLDLEIASDSDLNLLKLKTLALPKIDGGGDSLRSFLDTRLMLVFRHGQRDRPHSDG